MSPDFEARVLGILDDMKDAQKDFEGRISAEFSGVKTEVMRLGTIVNNFDTQCGLKHQLVNSDIAGLRQSSADLKKAGELAEQKKLTDLEQELHRRDDERRKWLFWGVTTGVGLLLSGGGIVAVLVKVFSSK